LRPGTKEPCNVLLVRVVNILYPVTLDALHQIFVRFGTVEKVVMFDKGSGFQALVQMHSTGQARAAFDAADSQEMYAGCNLLRVGYSSLK
ncbi:unnamed protein product, partial [Phaeothamnion confervicola]